MSRKRELLELLGTVLTDLVTLDEVVRRGVVSEGEYSDLMSESGGGYEDGKEIDEVRDWEYTAELTCKIRENLRLTILMMGDSNIVAIQ